MKLIGEMNLGAADDSINNHTKVSKEEWKVMKFDHLSKETFHDIKTALEEEQKALLTANNNIIEQRLLFEGENNDLEFFLGDDEDIVLLNFSGTIMATKQSTLGMCKDSVLAKQFDDPLWVQQYKASSVKKWSCEDVAKRVT